MTSNPQVPSYEPMLAAYHRAFAAELRAMIGELPITGGQTVLDMACGDGAYTPWLAERVGSRGHIVAVDTSLGYLGLARMAAGKSRVADVVGWSAASIDRLPFDDDTFDLCWCAQSLFSLPDPVEALRALLRVTRPGGIVAVLEDDTLHNVLLPWPIEVELSVRVAELRALTASTDRPGKFYVGRQLRHVFREAGLERIETRTFAADRGAPLGTNETVFFTEYLKGLSQRTGAYLDPNSRPRFDRLVDPASRDFLLSDPDLTATCIDHVVWGRKPHPVS